MYKLILIIITLFSSIFAETLYLKDMRKIEVIEVEIGEEEVKYNIRKYDGYTHTIKKTDIVAILDENGSIIYAIEGMDEELILKSIEEIEKRIEVKEAKEKSFDKENTAASLNIIPGLGSLVIMNDLTGAIIQWVLLGSGISLLVYAYNTCDQGLDCLNSRYPFWGAGLLLTAGSIFFGVFRPFEQNPDFDFNFVILPNKQGDLKTYLFYNVAF